MDVGEKNCGSRIVDMDILSLLNGHIIGHVCHVLCADHGLVDVADEAFLWIRALAGPDTWLPGQADDVDAHCGAALVEEDHILAR